MAKRIYSGCNKVVVNKYKRSKHIIIKYNVLQELNRLENYLQSQGLDLDYCTLVLLGIDSYKKSLCSP